jgi:uncharacterized protein (TIGR00255 family)
MTGFGKAVTKCETCTYVCEIKSLNSKSTDIRIKMPSALFSREILLRKIVTEKAIRGRIEVMIEVQDGDTAIEQKFNAYLAKQYFHQLVNLSNDLGIKSENLLPTIISLPGVVSEGLEDISDDQWEPIQQCIESALENMKSYRKVEGKVLASDLNERVITIENLIPKILPFEEARIIKQREKLRKSLEEFQMSDKVDLNRFEQEVVYYLEKNDITEEKIRLTQHCLYFKEQLLNDNEEVGKILSFISQEMGREINTLGSKAQDFDIQQIVVIMKDELEKIKEQLANIL